LQRNLLAVVKDIGNICITLATADPDFMKELKELMIYQLWRLN